MARSWSVPGWSEPDAQLHRVALEGRPLCHRPFRGPSSPPPHPIPPLVPLLVGRERGGVAQATSAVSPQPRELRLTQSLPRFGRPRADGWFPGRMRQIRSAGVALAACVGLAGCLAGGTTAGGSPAGTRASAGTSGIQKIQHVVIVMQENRSFDEYFGTYPGVDGLPMQSGQFTTCVPDPRGGCEKPYHDP